MKTLNALIRNSAIEYSYKTALQMKIDGDYDIVPYGILDMKANSLASVLRKRGIEKDDKVAILSENRLEWPVTFFAVQKLGAVAVPIDKERSEPEIEFILRHSESKILLGSKKYLNKAQGFGNVIDFEDGLDTVIGSHFNVLERIEEHIGEDDLAIIAYTSGTTGNPKGVMLTHKNIMADIHGIKSLVTIKEEDNFLSILPLYHMFELTGGMLAPLEAGSTITYLGDGRPRPDKIKAAMKETKTSVLLCVPQLYELMYNGICKKTENLRSENMLAKIDAKHALFRYTLGMAAKPLIRMYGKHEDAIIGQIVRYGLGGNIRMFVSGGAAISPDTVVGFGRLGIGLYQGYGLTETSPVASVNPETDNRAGSSGRPISGVEMKLADVPHMEIYVDKHNEGEILIKGPNVMQGYFKDQEATAEAIKDGWFSTGDIGKIIDDYVHITGRAKDIVVTGGGQNVSAAKLENILTKCEYVQEAIVLGKKSGPNREDVCAAIYMAEGAAKADVLAYILEMNKGLADFEKINKQNVVFVDEEFEKTSLRKIKKFKYRHLFD